MYSWDRNSKENYRREDFYLLRAVAAHRGLYGNSGAEAIYPTCLVDAEGKPFNAAEDRYTMTFPKDALPPVNAF